MGLLLLGAAAAEAQTVRILVSNSGQLADDAANTSGNDHAQLFSTGANAAGYTLTQVVVNSEDAAGDDFDVEVCEEDGTADEFPSSTAGDCTALTAPGSFTAGNLHFEHAGLALSANTNYVVVIKQIGTGSVELNSTTSGGEDTSLGLSDWGIKDKFYWKSGSTWMLKSGSDEALRIIVRGVLGDISDATLSALSVSGATLSPAFDAATTTYSATVANAVNQVTITQTTSETTATVEYLDGSDATLTDADAMTAGLQVNLSVGANIVKVKVTAPNGTTTKTYTVNVLRGAVPATCSVASMVNQVWTANLTVGTQTVAGFILYGWNGTANYNGASLTDEDFSFAGDTYEFDEIYFAAASLTVTFGSVNSGDIATQATREKLTFHVGSDSFNLGAGTLAGNQRTISWTGTSLSWAASDSVCLALTADSPAVSSVALTSAPGTDNTYAIGDDVEATVTFDAAVDITGTPQLELDFDGTAKAAACATGTNTTTMACSYTVLVGEEAPNGVEIAANKLTGGTITTTGTPTVTADRDHVAVLIDTGHKVDGIRPTLVTTGSDAPTTSTDGTQVILTFSEDLGISFVLNVVDLSVGGVSGQAAGATPSISGGRTVTLTLVSAATIAAGETVTLTVGTGAVQDAAGNTILGVTGIAVTNAVGSTTAPTVSGVALTSAPGVDNTYAIGDAVEATVTFSEAVDITGNPQLELDFDGTAKAAACATGTNMTTMACSYTVLVGEEAPNGVAIEANKLTGGTITATGSTTAADLDHAAVPIDAGHKVDGIRPTLVTTGSDAPTTSPDGETVLLVFSEDIGAVSHSDITIQANSVTLSTTMASVAGTKVEITLTTALTTTATNLTVALAADAVDDAAGNGILAVAATTVTNAVVTTGSNTAPAFSSTTTTRSVAENSPANTDVGAAVTATDDDNDTLTYTLEGADAASFTIVSTSGQIRTTSGVTYDFETKPSYTVIVKADDGNGGTDTIEVTINLTDVFEPLGPPTNLRSTRGNEQVTLRWTAPVNTGGGPITDYEYEQDGDGNWISTGGTATRYTVTGLTNGQEYTFRVRAVNGIDVPAESSSLSATPRRPRPPPPPRRRGGAPDGSDSGGGRKRRVHGCID